MKTILLFGAGKSASVLIDYLMKEVEENKWKFIVADANKEQVLSKTRNSPFAEAVEVDITNDDARSKLIQRAHVVISMMPPSLHFMIAKDCVEHRVHLLTASYLDQQIRSLRDEINHRKLFFLCEMGLDPGIDHMSAMQILDNIRESGGVVNSFKSHCGGLVAPESDDNPWHYKISWNPRNVVLAGKAGAVYKQDNEIIKESYEDLFQASRLVTTGNADMPEFSYYPNRDSLPYIDLYHLHDAATFVRTTLRYADFMFGWRNIISLHLTDETPQYQSDGRTLQNLFHEHLEKYGFKEWFELNVSERFTETKSLLENLMNIVKAEQRASESGEEFTRQFMVVDETGDLKDIDVEKLKTEATLKMSEKIREADLILKQLLHLGVDDEETVVNRGFCSPADLLQFALEKKLALLPGDKDLVVMLHEIEYTIAGRKEKITSSLFVKGDDHIYTAMAKTVGLPLGIAAKLILKGELKMTGLHIPVSKALYEPILAELKNNGVVFTETKTPA